MKPTILLIFLFIFPIHVHMISDSDIISQFRCSGSFYIDRRQQDKCDKKGSECTTKLGQIGQCEDMIRDSSVTPSNTPDLRCCPNQLIPEDFQSNMKCGNTQQLGLFAYCKNGYVYSVSLETYRSNNETSITCDLNLNCAKGSYCVLSVDMNNTLDRYVRKCFVIDPPEEEDNTVLIIIIVAVVVLLIIIVGIVVGILVCKKMRKRKSGHKNNSAESSANSEEEKKEKPSKEKKPKKGSNV
ncbi:unnamed protein product [Caenorhabditis angaria]|uniref:Domain of unknown function DX domain-containing protein n=1 Tax=Caenorhabditis angaria TaxID=860376 RepID=A0A9P1N3Z5_9PELO|nr:unnamed protein product [Caenorhabditis angaria]